MSTETAGLCHVTSIETNKPSFTGGNFIIGLGTKLRLSSWLESVQGMFEQHLPEIESASVTEAN
jgi:hypothetical protein